MAFGDRAFGSWTAASACVFALRVALGVSLGSAAWALPVVYQSPADDGFDPGTPFALSGAPTESLYLYVDSGPLATTVGSPCVDGTGDELCAYRFCVQTSDTVGVVDFLPEAGRDIVWRTSATELCATGGQAMVGELGPIRVGELILTSTGDGDAQIVEGEVVNASLTLDGVPLRVLAVPEPGVPLQLAIGILFLFVVSRWRHAP